MADERSELERVLPSDEVPVIRPGYPRGRSYADLPGYGYGYGYGEQEDNLNLHELWRTLRKRKLLILILTVIITTIVTIEAYRTKSTYQALAFIEMSKEGPAVRSGPNETVIQTEDPDFYYPELSINTHLFRLTSEPLLESVVAKLKLDQNPKFVDTGKKSVWEAMQAIRKSDDPQPEEQLLTPLSEAETEATRSGARSQKESDRLMPYVGILAGGLRAEQVKETRTLKVTFIHTDPEIAAAVANGVAREFIEQSFESKTEKYTNASKWLDTTTREFKAKVERAEQDLADYTRTHNIFSTEGKETLTTDKLSRLHDQATRAETERILKQSLYEEVKAGRVAQLPAAFADLRMGALQVKLDELQATADKLDLKYGPENPQVVDTKQQIKTIKGQIEAGRRSLEEKLRSEYELALRDERSLKAALQGSKGEAVQQNQDAIQYNILKQEVDTAKSLYTDFLQKTNQAKVEVAQQHNNLRLIQPARVPKSPIGPQRFRMIMFGFFMSLATGVGLAYFLEYLDNTIKTVDDVSRYMQLPALGVIPAMIADMSRKSLEGKNGKSKRRIAGKDRNQQIPGLHNTNNRLMVFDNRSSAAEAYRVIRTSILLSAAGHPPKTTLITSGQPGEGKTTTVINTAVSLAQLGASVLIIDCDLRKPATHKVLGIDNELGISTYLSRDMEIDGLIHMLQIPNLSLLPCGPIPPNPAELISSDRMKNLLRMMAERYDHVLIDSPPLINVTDSVILSSMVDGVILVVHGGKSTRAVAQRARQELVSVGAKIFGVVLNNVDVRREGYSHYYYQGYYSDYGHGPEANS